jgi:hypothetical protein
MVIPIDDEIVLMLIYKRSARFKQSTAKAQKLSILK